MKRQTSGVPGAVLLLFSIGVCTLDAGSNVAWRRAAYWDPRYPTCWTSGTAIRDGLEYDGYQILDADQLKTWMNARSADGANSVVVFCRDVVPDTVVAGIRLWGRRQRDGGPVAGGQSAAGERRLSSVS